ncbi:hypothetical protein ACVBGC_15550 [Burkholderia stagnalis]
MQRCFASVERAPRHLVMTGRAWHDGGSAEAAGDACRCTRSGGVVAAASMRRWRAGGVSRPAALSIRLPCAFDATDGASPFAACATGGAAHANAISAYRPATAVRESRILILVFIRLPDAVDCPDLDPASSRVRAAARVVADTADAARRAASPVSACVRIGAGMGGWTRIRRRVDGLAGGAAHGDSADCRERAGDAPHGNP